MWFPGNGTWQPVPLPPPPAAYFANADYSSQQLPVAHDANNNPLNTNTADHHTLSPTYGYPFGTVQASPTSAPTSPGFLFNSTVQTQATPCRLLPDPLTSHPSPPQEAML